MTDAIADGSRVQHLEYFLNFLETWEERPACLTPMAYQWCSAFTSMIAGPGQDWAYTRQAHLSSLMAPSSMAHCHMSYDPDERFTGVGPGCDLVHRAHRLQRGLSLYDYVDLLFKTLKIGFRLAWPGCDLSAIRLDRTSHRDPVFKIAFSSDDDEVIADSVCAWITDIYRTPAGSLARYFADRVGRS